MECEFASLFGAGRAREAAIENIKWIAVLGAACAAIYGAATAPSYAGPCSANIDAMQARVDARLEARAAAGPTAKEGGFAGMSDQPTPASIAAAEARLGDIPAKKVSVVKRAVVRARAADAAGDGKACERELAVVQHAMGH